jgi:hypothetical protein
MENQFNKRMDRSPRQNQQNVIPLQPRMAGQYQYRNSKEPEIIYLRPHRKIKRMVSQV